MVCDSWTIRRLTTSTIGMFLQGLSKRGVSNNERRGDRDGGGGEGLILFFILKQGQRKM